MTINTFQGLPGMHTAVDAVPVTTSDTVALTDVSRGLFIGVGGDVSVEMLNGGSARVFKNVPSGSILPAAVTRVNATNTTATNILALY